MPCRDFNPETWVDDLDYQESKQLYKCFDFKNLTMIWNTPDTAQLGTYHYSMAMIPTYEMQNGNENNPLPQ